MNNLFDTEEQTKHQPLAAVLRPRILDDVIDQEAFVDQARSSAAGSPPINWGSLILYGPPGIVITRDRARRRPHAGQGVPAATRDAWA